MPSQPTKRSENRASAIYEHKTTRFQGDYEQFLIQLKGAYQACRILNHHIGFALMREVSDREGWSLNLSEIARIWTQGCIIRSELMEELVEIYKEDEELLLVPAIVEQLKSDRTGFVAVVTEGLGAGISLPVLSSALNYYVGFQTEKSPANLIQAQRDYFGQHLPQG